MRKKPEKVVGDDVRPDISRNAPIASRQDGEGGGLRPRGQAAAGTLPGYSSAGGLSESMPQLIARPSVPNTW